MLNSQGEFAISEEGRNPWARAPTGNRRKESRSDGWKQGDKKATSFTDYKSKCQNISYLESLYSDSGAPQKIEHARDNIVPIPVSPNTSQFEPGWEYKSRLILPDPTVISPRSSPDYSRNAPPEARFVNNPGSRSIKNPGVLKPPDQQP
jgi:hypothetical protein